MESVNSMEMKKAYAKPLAGLIALASVGFAVFHGIYGNMVITIGGDIGFWTVAGITVAAGVMMLISAFKERGFVSAAAVLLQIAGLVCFDYYVGSGLEGAATLDLDWFAVIICLVTCVMGAIVCWRTGGSIHHIVSILAVCGMALSDDFLWMFMFWTILTYCSYRLVKTDRAGAADCAAKLLAVNSFAGVSFCVGISVSGLVFDTVDITTLNLIDTVYADMIAMSCIFMVLAGMMRSMQIPFQRWFSHEYKVSAGAGSIIQAVTLVNSGAVLVIKMAPAMGVSNFAGLMAIIIGGVTFFISSLNAITEINSRKMLADSTSSIMGLVIMCAGIGNSEAVWAAIILLIFHSVAKPLLLAGTEQGRLRTDLVMGVIVMMAAPFAIVLLQRESLGSIVDTGNIILAMILCFSGAIAILYWTRWLGTMIGEAVSEGIEGINLKEMNPFKANAWLLILLILGLPFLSRYMVVPYMGELFGGMSAAANLTDNIMDSAVIAAAVALAAYPMYKGVQRDESRQSDRNKEVGGTREILRKSKSTIRAQIICSIVAIAVIVMCLGFIILNLSELLGGVLQW